MNITNIDYLLPYMQRQFLSGTRTHCRAIECVPSIFVSCRTSERSNRNGAHYYWFCILSLKAMNDRIAGAYSHLTCTEKRQQLFAKLLYDQTACTRWCTTIQHTYIYETKWCYCMFHCTMRVRRASSQKNGQKIELSDLSFSKMGKQYRRRRRHLQHWIDDSNTISAQQIAVI